MKMITAIVQPENLNRIKKCLFDAKIMRFIIDDSWGHSDEEALTETYRGITMKMDLKKKARIQMAVNDDFVDIAIEAIKKGSQQSKKGAGKIFVTNIERCINLTTGEEGETAIGGYMESRS
jgi:nitrogen regulatory protein P-II 1